jgi:peptide/nickel transport system substrate-binding protein
LISSGPTRTLLAIVVFVSLVLSTLARAQEPSYGGELRVALNSDPSNLDPHRSTAFITRVVLGSVVEGLFTLDAAYTPIPELAESYEVSTDRLTYTIRLHDGITFHDGTEMTSADVVASLRRWLDLSSPGKVFSPKIESFEAVDDRTVRFVFKEPIGQLLVAALAFSYQAAAILPAEQISALGGEGLIDVPVGTGPYRIARVREGDRVRLERFEAYEPRGEKPNGYGGAKVPYLDAVVLITAPEASVRAAGLEAGDFDFALNLPADSLYRFQANRDITLYRPYQGSLDIVLNSSTGILSDPRLRDAFLAALDMDSMMLAAFGDPSLYRVDAGLWPQETKWWTDAGSENYNQKDMEKARALLQEAGYDGTPLRWMTTRENAGYYETAVVATQLLENAGFSVDLEVIDFATILSRRYDKSAWEVFQTGFSIQPDPTQYLVFDCNWAAFWCDEKKDRLLGQLAQDLPFEERYAAWEKLQAYYWDFNPAIKVGDYFNLYGSSKRVQGYPSLNQVVWYGAWLDE